MAVCADSPPVASSADKTPRYTDLFFMWISPLIEE
jgi:hypothetical protein